MTQEEPQVLTTTTAAESSTPIADSIAAELAKSIVTDLPVQETAAQAAAADGAYEDALPTEPTAEPLAETPADYVPDLAALSNANGDPHPWAHQLYQLIGYTTGKFIDETSLEEWLNLFGAQVQQAAIRSVFFAVASTPIPSRVPGDPSIALLEFRDELARSFRTAASL